MKSNAVNRLMPQRLWYLLHKTVVQAPRKPAGAVTPTSPITLYNYSSNENKNNNNSSGNSPNKEVVSKSHDKMQNSDTSIKLNTMHAETSTLSFHHTLTFRLVLPTSDTFY